MPCAMVTVTTEGCVSTHLCLMKGMLMQLAAATATKGTNRPMIGGRRWGRNRHMRSRREHSSVRPNHLRWSRSGSVRFVVWAGPNNALPWPGSWSPGRWPQLPSWHWRRRHPADWGKRGQTDLAPTTITITIIIIIIIIIITIIIIIPQHNFQKLLL